MRTQDLKNKYPPWQDRVIVGFSLFLQLILGFFLGHNYDIRIFMATGFFAGTGQNPYIPQDLSALFHNAAFRNLTTIGYPPPWTLVLGMIYRIVSAITPNLLVYNLAIKLPVIAANICLAFLVKNILMEMGAHPRSARKAWVFLLLNPFLLYTSAAWGQFDSVVALLSLLALANLYKGNYKSSAILLALALSCKPTALPLLPIVFIFIAGKPDRKSVV
jgi:Gpi18-like mannosyltransferase